MKNVPTRRPRRAWVEVDVGALRRNYRRLEDLLDPPARLLPMLKADGYGAGAVRVARALGELDPWGLGVATVEEGAELREHGCGGRIVVFSPCPPEDAGPCVRHRLEPVVSSPGALETFGREAEPGAPLTVHLELDTGMGRLGLLAEAAGEWIPGVRRSLERYPIEVGSTFTHFHSADVDPEATREQMERFRAALEALRAGGVEPGPTHAANSDALVRYSFARADVARPGIYLYGAGGWDPAPEPVMSLRARILDVREVPGGHPVSYGATYRTEGPTRLATLGIGYGDGLRRELSNRGSALVDGRRAPIRGRVCMDTTVVEVSDGPAPEPGDVATLLGRDGEEEIRVEEMAELCGTITYEILTGLGRRLPRVETSPSLSQEEHGDDGA